MDWEDHVFVFGLRIVEDAVLAVDFGSAQKIYCFLGSGSCS